VQVREQKKCARHGAGVEGNSSSSSSFCTMYSLYLHVMDGGHFQACGASPWNSSLQELSGGRSTLGARHLRPSRLSESAVRTTTWSPAAAPPLLLPSPVTTGCTNNLSARAQVRNLKDPSIGMKCPSFDRIRTKPVL